jgi:hypothetical protein
MHRLLPILAFAVLTTLSGGLGIVSEAPAQQRQQTGPPQRPQIILRERGPYGPPPPPSSNRNYYGPAPGVQPPMERVPQPAPLSEPPTNR